MIFYKNNKLYDTESINVEQINAGSEGAIYKVDNEAVKLYHPFCMKVRLGEYSVDRLSTIPTQRILMPKDKVYDANNMFCGYSTRYINEVDYNCFEHKMKDYLNELLIYENDINMLNANGVSVADMTYDNIVFSDDGIYMVDPGSFHFYDSWCAYNNNEELNRLFIQLLSWGLPNEKLVRELHEKLDNGKRLYQTIIDNLEDENESTVNYSLKLLNKR